MSSTKSGKSGVSEDVGPKTCSRLVVTILESIEKLRRLSRKTVNRLTGETSRHERLNALDYQWRSFSGHAKGTQGSWSQCRCRFHGSTSAESGKGTSAERDCG